MSNTNPREDNTDNHHDESRPLLTDQAMENDEKPSHLAKPPSVPAPEKAATVKSVPPELKEGWTADGLPLGHGSVVGEPMERSPWNSSLFACLGRNDEFCSSDVEVCLLGSAAPCVLYGSNAERLASAPGTFASHCLSYSAVYFMGYALFGWNCLAPWYSYHDRTAIRKKFNLEGSCEALHRSCGCCGCIMENDVRRELCESSCDLATHVFCHLCALCQEGRELRRRQPHPGFHAQPVLVMIPPGEQTMGPGA